MQLDAYKIQRDHEEARKKDSERASRIFQQVLTSEGAILKVHPRMWKGNSAIADRLSRQELEEHRIEMREAVLFIRKVSQRFPRELWTFDQFKIFTEPGSCTGRPAKHPRAKHACDSKTLARLLERP